MPDSKISALTAITALTDDDLLVVVDGAAVTNKITVGNAKVSLTDGAVLKTLADAKGDLFAASAADTVGRLAVGADGTSPLADSNQTLGIKYVGSELQKVPGGFFYPTGIFGAATSTGNHNQQAFWFPYFLPRRCSPTLYIYCGTLEAGSTARFSTWSNDEATMKPATGGLIEDVGTVSGATTGSKSITVATPIGPGWVWLGVWLSNHTTVRWFKFNAGANVTVFGDDSFTNTRLCPAWTAGTLDYSASWNSTLPSLTVANTTTYTNMPAVAMTGV